jgi:hypothetical protein
VLTVLNAPNFLTLLRIVAIPCFLILLEDHRWSEALVPIRESLRRQREFAARGIDSIGKIASPSGQVTMAPSCIWINCCFCKFSSVYSMVWAPSVVGNLMATNVAMVTTPFRLSTYTLIDPRRTSPGNRGSTRIARFYIPAGDLQHFSSALRP